jgi:alanyl aminopeptidase
VTGFLVTALVLLGCEQRQQPADTPTASEIPIRLPQSVVPQHYRLGLSIVPDLERFSGRVEIDVLIRESVDRIWMHAADLTFDAIDVLTESGDRFAVEFHDVNIDGLGYLQLPGELAPQSIELSFEYTAPFSDGLHGLYRVVVGDDNYAFSQFETIYARLAFPSFDEPAFKTPFDIHVTTRDGYQALGNTREVDREPLDNGLQRITYATTEPLPTYLIAFAVGPLDVVEWEPIPPNAYRDRPVPLRGAAVRGQGAKMSFALKNTAVLVNSLEAYFGIPYPFDKLDLVAVPDFAWGGMENAGLITYTESALLLDDQPSTAQLRFFANLHAHELAHQWFGNFVTMEWWDDVWLNEAFATWIAARIIHETWPELVFYREIQISSFRAMEQDSLSNSRRIREPVETSDDIENAFDAITYKKGAAVLAMLENFLGADIFQQGIRRYLRDHAFGSATVFDLMAALEAESEGAQQVTQTFQSFLDQSGVPYISAQLTCSDENISVNLSQERFLPVGSTADPIRRWQVPVCLAFGVDDGERGEQCLLLTESQQEFTLDTPNCPAWLIPNARGAGYYRWRVPESETIRLYAVANEALTAAERISFADSLLAGLESGSVPMDEFLKVLPLFGQARERAVITAMFPTYRRLLRHLLDEPSQARAHAYAVDIYLPLLNALEQDGVWETPAEQALLRRALTNFLALELAADSVRLALAAAAEQYRAAKGESSAGELDPDLRGVALAVAVQDSDPQFTDALIDLFRDSMDPQLRTDILFALAHADSAATVDTVRKLVLSDQLKSNELSWYLYWSLDAVPGLSNWQWLQQNFEALIPRLSERAKGQGALRFASSFCAAEQAAELEAELEALFNPYLDEFIGSARNVEAGLELISLCMAFRDAHADAAVRFFAADSEQTAEIRTN